MKAGTMEGKIVLVTGATAGIGRVTARALADLGAQVVFTARSSEKAEVTRAWITGETGNPLVSYLIADFSSLAQVRRLAKEFNAKYDSLDVLINNAGAIFFRRAESEDGVEMTFAVNHLAPFLLTNLLLPTLQNAERARIVTVSSRAHVRSVIDFDDLAALKDYRAIERYGRSKLANLLFTYELARRLDATDVTANALHPGFVASHFGKNNGFLARALMPVALLAGRAISEEAGAKTSVYLASSPEVEGVTGKYFVECKEAPSSEASHDEKAMITLWEISSRMAGLPVSV